MKDGCAALLDASGKAAQRSSLGQYPSSSRVSFIDLSIGTNDVARAVRAVAHQLLGFSVTTRRRVEILVREGLDLKIVDFGQVVLLGVPLVTHRVSFLA